MMRTVKRDPFSSLELVEAFHLGHALSTLKELRILTSLGRPSTSTALARKHRVQPSFLNGILEYLAVRTDLISKIGRRFVMTQRFSREARFLLELYLGAYGRNACELKILLRKPIRARIAVNRVRHAKAFEEVGPFAFRWIAQILLQLRFNHVLDLGCGSGGLLLELATQNLNFVGWGLEMNEAMCRFARRNIRLAHVGDRLKILKGNLGHLCQDVPNGIRSQVHTIAACHVANEMFGHGSSRVVHWLRDVRKAFPGRSLVLLDYYGRLGTVSGGNQRETLLHDYVQHISGQGVPPSNLAEWRAIYGQAGCRLVSVLEDKKTTRFVHILML